MTTTAPLLDLPPISASTTSRRGVALPVAHLLARRTDTRSAVLLLPVLAFAATTTLLLTVLAGGMSFLRWEDGDLAGTYQMLAGFALVLLLVPLASLGGAAARLSARRRDDRLAALRLLGATTGTVARLTTLEAAAVALIGAVGGVLGYLALAPLVQLVHFRGEPIGAAYWLAPGAVTLTVAGVVVLAVLSAAVGLRQVSISPLGVHRRRDVPRIGWKRAAVGGGVILLAALAMQGSYASVAILLAVVLSGFGATMAVLNVLGPWVIAVLARHRRRRASTPAQLLAAAAMADSPKAVWRQISGAVMAAFIAVVAGGGAALMAATEGPTEGPEQYLAQDIQTGVLITVVATFLMVAVSAGITQVAEVLDRGTLYRSLDRLGMPVTTMAEAQRSAVLTPLVVLTTATVVVSGTLVLPLTGMAVLLAPLSVAVVAGAVVVGLLLVRLGIAAAQPVLRRTVTSGGAR